MKILYACNDMDFFVAHRLFLAEAILRDGHEVSLAVEEEADPEKAKGLRVVRLKLNRYRFAPWRDLQLLYGYYREIKASRPDIIHAITIKPIIFVSIVLLFFRGTNKPKLVLTFPGLGKIFEDNSGLYHALRRTIVKAALRFCSNWNHPYATFENDENRKTLIEYGIVTPSDSKVVMGTGIGPEFKPAEKRGNKLIVCFAGRLLNAKGIGLYIEAAEKLQSDDCTSEFQVAGEWDSKDRDSIDIQKIHDAETKGLIRFLGRIPAKDMPGVLQKADILCLPTMLREGLPRVVLEAAACGCALVVSDQGSTRPFVKDGVTGYRIAPVTVDQVTSALDKLLKDVNKTREMGANAAKLVNALPVSEIQVLGEFKKVYARVLGN